MSWIKKKKINVKYVLKEEYSQEVNAAGEDPEPMLQFIASMVFPISYSWHCWLPAPQRWEEDLRLSLHPASPIATAANQQLPWSRGGGTSLRLLCSLSPPYKCLLCNRQPHLLQSDICIPWLHLLSNKQTTHQLGSWNERAIPGVNLWFKCVWDLYRQTAIIKQSITSCLKDKWSILQTFQKGPTSPSSSQHHAEKKSTVPVWGFLKFYFSAATLVLSL